MSDDAWTYSEEPFTSLHIGPCAECGRLREQLDDRERGFAKLVLLAHERGDEYWQDQLQIVGDFTLAEARAALGVEGE